jgi:thiol:disulfide interchange protein DsbD
LIVDRLPDGTSREFWVGLRFELEQGWHVYWQNPGDSGGPPTAFWEPSRGLTLDGFEWPVPERIPLGPLVNYGYTAEVVLPFRVRTATPLAAGASATIGGQVKWLICHDICIPDQARLTLTWPLAPGDRAKVPTWQQQIAAAREAVPRPAPAAWKPRAASSREEFVLTLQVDSAATTATFFPLEVSQINDSAPQAVTTKGRELVLRLRKSDQLAKDPAVLRGVVVLAGGRAHVVEAPVGAAARSTTSSQGPKP